MSELHHANFDPDIDPKTAAALNKLIELAMNAVDNGTLPEAPICELGNHVWVDVYETDDAVEYQCMICGIWKTETDDDDER